MRREHTQMLPVHYPPTQRWVHEPKSTRTRMAAQRSSSLSLARYLSLLEGPNTVSLSRYGFHNSTRRRRQWYT